MTQTAPLDLIDRKIVAALMADATIPIAQIADKVGLSQTPCWKRIQKLEANGVLTGRVALADPAMLGFGLTVFVGIEAPDHGTDWRAAFARAMHLARHASPCAPRSPRKLSCRDVGTAHYNHRIRTPSGPDAASNSRPCAPC